jgi:hypothetical protein
MTTSNALLQCFNNGTQVTLGAHYELLDQNLMVETLTVGGSVFAVTIFHKVSSK